MQPNIQSATDGNLNTIPAAASDITRYVILQFPIVLLIPGLGAILPQVGTTWSDIFAPLAISGMLALFSLNLEFYDGRHAIMSGFYDCTAVYFIKTRTISRGRNVISNSRANDIDGSDADSDNPGIISIRRRSEF